MLFKGLGACAIFWYIAYSYQDKMIFTISLHLHYILYVGVTLRMASHMYV